MSSPRQHRSSARAGRELSGLLLLFSASACTAAGDYEPALVGIESAGGRGSGSGATSEAPAPAEGATSPAPTIESGSTDSPVRLLPDEMVGDSAGGTRSGAEGADAVPEDAGLDASRPSPGGAEGSSEEDAGGSPSDAGPPPVAPPDASPPPSPLDAAPPPPADACPGVVFEGSCYQFFEPQRSWNEAEEHCIAWGGHLASVESPEEDAFLGAWPALLGVPLLDGSGLWLGGTDARREGDFRWWDDSPLRFAGWASDQPNNGAGIDCIEKRNDATQRWYDRRCTDGERYVCERPE